jgi:hypothetical protein
VNCGIDSMSLNPDAVLATTRLVVEAEAAQDRPVRPGPDLALASAAVPMRTISTRPERLAQRH